jgi:cell wall-associated NlpC family hydrolase
VKWYNNYEGFPYKHLGNDPDTGIDCFNIIKLIYKQERNIDLPYDTISFCNIIDENWYDKINEDLFANFNKPEYGW